MMTTDALTALRFFRCVSYDLSQRIKQNLNNLLSNVLEFLQILWICREDWLKVFPQKKGR